MSKNETVQAPTRADVVGSFLRPAALKEAREKLAKGEIDAQALREVENRCISDLVQKEKAHGLRVITDGEFRRAYWHLDFFWGLQGVEHIELEHGYQFHGEETTKGSIRVTGKISGENHPWVDNYKWMRQFEEPGIAVKVTIPSPAQLLAELARGTNTLQTLRIYPKTEELIADVAAAYRQVINALYEAGCRNIQLDDCTWGMVVDDNYWSKRLGHGVTLEGEAQKYLKVNNGAIDGHPADLVINTHCCRGNYHSTYAASGSYDRVAPYLLAQEHADAFYLEYDDERSGNFEALRYVPEGKKVVLGLVTTKRPELEDEDAVIARIADAAKIIPLERLYLSPQCGFASCEIGNKLTEDEQWAKVDLVQRIARRVWGK